MPPPIVSERAAVLTDLFEISSPSSPRLCLIRRIRAIGATGCFRCEFKKSKAASGPPHSINTQATRTQIQSDLHQYGVRCPRQRFGSVFSARRLGCRTKTFPLSAVSRNALTSLFAPPFNTRQRTPRLRDPEQEPTVAAQEVFPSEYRVLGRTHLAPRPTPVRLRQE